MKIGIDIDNVIANTFADLIPYYNRFMGYEAAPQEVVETMRKRKIKMLQYYFRAWRQRVMTKISLIDGAKETIQQWHPKHEISLITSRLSIFNRQTRSWLDQHSIPYHSLHHAKEKTKHLKADGCQVFIEDNFEECEILADHCERVFLFDYPWNRRPTEKDNIIRVKNWSEIARQI
jgi:uncharacterized HAD superfamily protein